MSVSTQVFVGVLFGFGYVVPPVMLFWGWARWLRRPKQRSIASTLSLVGLGFATASGLLALSSAVYAQLIHGFPFYDPLLLRIFRTGFLLSLAGIVFGISGAMRPNSLRWHAPLSAAGMLAFWFVAALGE
jgi:hypothetical protein